MPVVSNTTPLNYLVFIEQADVLPTLYGRIVVPQAVIDELQYEAAPPAVRQWIDKRPEWLEVRQVNATHDAALEELGAGEREAILMAQQTGASAIILDERAARQEARSRGLSVTGTLAVLDKAAERGLIDLAEAFWRLQRTSFRASPELYQRFLDRDAERRH